ncbi:hypothetical protein [Streptomyces scopuliridis]|uniref:hypothetical protein n=1 Tax=Streptomyces scopuliridis TaxID=452529 RepID=UPI003426F12C
MLSVRRTVVAAALACLSALAITASGANAQAPVDSAPAAVRADDLVPVDTPVRLVDTLENRGINVAAHLNWDYVYLSKKTNGGDRQTIFHREGDGYTIQEVEPHWDGYDYWQSTGDGVLLNKKSKATVFTVKNTDRGLQLTAPSGSHPTCTTENADRWLHFYQTISGTSNRFVYFRIEK